MFDNTKPNVIILADHTDPVFLQKMLGPYKVAHELRQSGIEVCVIQHLHIFSYDELKYILKNIISDNTLFVGINSIFYQSTENVSILDDNKLASAGGIEYANRELGMMLPHGKSKNADFKQFIRGLNPKCKIVLGGPDAIDADYAKDFDYVIVGYADLSIVNLTKHLMDSSITLKKSFKSIYGPIILNDNKAEGFDFVNSTLIYKDYDAILPNEVLTIEISRGCIFKCAFCSYPLNGKKKLDYIKHEELLYREFLDNYERFGVTRYMFADDTFNDSKDKVEMIYNISKKLPFQLEYWAYVRLDLFGAHKDQIEMAFASGLRGCFFGIETFNEKTGDAIGKGSPKEKQLATLKYIKDKWGDEVMLHGSFIFGLPYEDIDSIKRTQDILLSKDSNLDSFGVRELFLYSHTREKEFSSDLDLNYEKYGYRIIGEKPPFLIWDNGYMTSETAHQLAKEVLDESEQNGSRMISSNGAFFIANLDYELSFARNKKIIDFPWHTIDLKKQERARLYKDTLCKELGIPLINF